MEFDPIEPGSLGSNGGLAKVLHDLRDLVFGHRFAFEAVQAIWLRR